MSKAPKTVEWTDRRRFGVLVGVAAAASLAGALIGRTMATGPQQAVQPRRPIVQIVRSQTGLPSLAQTIDTACPAIATIIQGGASPGPVVTKARTSKGHAFAPAAAFVVSADGWLLTSGAVQSASHLDAIFSDGGRFPVSTLRTDPVSGLALAKIDSTDLPLLTFADQEAATVGDFGFAVETPTGRGCSAQIAMISSDFLADGGGPVSYLRVQSPMPAVAAGAPFLAADGKVIAIATDDAAAAGEFLPAPLAGMVVDELIRGTPSPSIAFGFRASDTAGTLSARLPNSRPRGAGIALVQPRSAANKAGLEAGDVVVAVNGSPVSSTSELNRALDATTGNAALTVMRGDQRVTMQVPRSIPAAH